MTGRFDPPYEHDYIDINPIIDAILKSDRFKKEILIYIKGELK